MNRSTGGSRDDGDATGPIDGRCKTILGGDSDPGEDALTTMGSGGGAR